MDAPANFCTFCGKPAVQAHHITGRGPDGRQLHDTTTVDLCHRHHVLIHEDLRLQGIDRPPVGGLWTMLGRIEHTLRRVAVFLARFGESADNPVWSKLAQLLESMADEIGYVDGDLDPLVVPS